MLIIGEKGREHKQNKEVPLNFEKMSVFFCTTLDFIFPSLTKVVILHPGADRDVELDLSSIAGTDIVILH